jgi:hypothetical protein
MNRVHCAALDRREGDGSSIDALMAADERAREHALQAVQDIAKPGQPSSGSSPTEPASQPS